ncbi:MAG: PD-(D/E)XK nuclease family protein [Planctomycetes bacterium]|nr:PD-(D/E)XK nuclease family protein [Planctomycetota bacterium]
MNRVFLDWTQPGLVTAARYLIQTRNDPSPINLSGMVVAVPGSRAGRRLLEILVQEAEHEKIPLIPPEIVTLGRLPELLYRAGKPFAGDLVQDLAWAEALSTVGQEQLKTITSALPESNRIEAWLELGRMVRNLHQELAAEGLDFSDVASQGVQVRTFPEAPRWQSLARIQRSYLNILNGLGLWDLQSARRHAIENRECHTGRDLVLLGTVDLNGQQRRMLDQVQDRVTVLVLAPEALKHRFDSLGCLLPEMWIHEPIEIDMKQVQQADGPAEQAALAVQAIADLEGNYSTEEISLGVPDEEVAPYLKQVLDENRISTRYAGGMPLRRSGPYRCLSAVADHLSAPRFQSFAALVRHPAIQSWLEGSGLNGWLSDLDRFQTDCLPYTLTRAHAAAATDPAPWIPVYDEVKRLLKPLGGNRQPLHLWVEPIFNLIVGLYGQRTYDPAKEADHLIVESFRHLKDELHGFETLPDPLIPRTTGAEALRLLLRQTSNAGLPPLAHKDALELLGWLELPLDDAPVLMVTGFNEGIIPSSINEDPFLPNGLRRVLGLVDNHRRYARDAYALNVLSASKEALTLIMGRRRANGDPLNPSRLLFACHEEEAARRALSFFVPPESNRQETNRYFRLRAGNDRSQLPIPRPLPLAEEITSMRVTEFRDYLACPYRYYLRHCLDLEGLDDHAEELDGGAFGSLAHAVLSAFGSGGFAASLDPQAIAVDLERILDRLVQRRFGKQVKASVLIQIEQLRLRLRAFAQWQAAWSAKGWRIRFLEISPPKNKAALVVDGRPMFLRGRIDRIDFHEKTGAWMIFDYKTGNEAKSPEKVHCNRNGWVDLQLPLYRHLAKALGLQGDPGLGYIALPKQPEKTDAYIAQWTAADLEDADRTAARVVRNVREEKFWPPESAPSGYFGEYASICQEGYFRGFPESDPDNDWEEEA